MNKRKSEMIRSIQPRIDAEFPLLMEEISGYAAEHQGKLREALAVRAESVAADGEREKGKGVLHRDFPAGQQL